MQNVEVQCYLIVKQQFSGNGVYTVGRPSLKISKGKPATEANEVAVQLNIQLPFGLFKKPQITANIRIEDDSAPFEITAEIQENIAEAIKSQTGFDVRISVDATE